MTIYIQPNLTVFPTTSTLTIEAIRQMSWIGFTSDTTEEQIVSAGFIAIAEPFGEQPSDTILVIDKNQSNEYIASWMPTVDYQQMSDVRAAAGFVRTRRNLLLTQTDWTQGKDIPDETSALWAPYRQELRDITTQSGYPLNISWPVPPGL